MKWFLVAANFDNIGHRARIDRSSSCSFGLYYLDSSCMLVGISRKKERVIVRYLITSHPKAHVMQELTYLNFFLDNLDFTIEYISLHYPFTEEQVMKHMPHLIKGNAFYSQYENDICSIVSPVIGLCFNQNIPWTEALKRKWFIGYQLQLTGLDCGSTIQAYYDEEQQITIVLSGSAPDIYPDNLFDIIPLQVHKELWDRQALSEQHGQGWDSGINREVLEEIVYDKLSPLELDILFHKSREIALYNDSIWDNTLKYELTLNLFDTIIRRAEWIKEILTFDEEVVPTKSNNRNIPASDELKGVMITLGFTEGLEDDERDDYFSREQFDK